MQYTTGTVLTVAAPETAGPIAFDTAPDLYRHWRVDVEGRVATLTLDVDEDAGIRPGYKLKLNSYDLGVDIELYNILQSIRFEHPEVACVVMTSAQANACSAPAPTSTCSALHARLESEFLQVHQRDAQRHGRLQPPRWPEIRGRVERHHGGRRLRVALACDEIVLIDDRSRAVSLPEVPLLGVLPGTGGLTRVVDKRKVRRDLADMFCTNPTA